MTTISGRACLICRQRLWTAALASQASEPWGSFLWPTPNSSTAGKPASAQRRIVSSAVSGE